MKLQEFSLRYPLDLTDDLTMQIQIASLHDRYRYNVEFIQYPLSKGICDGEGLAYAVEYLDSVTTVGRVGTHIQSIVIVDSKKKEISEEISLEMRFATTASSGKRHALRALLLCQRVYFMSDTWSRTSESFGNMETIGLVEWDYIYKGWKEKSLRHWSSMSELQIQEGIRMFEPTAGADLSTVQRWAQLAPPNGTLNEGNLFLSRSDTDIGGGGNTCYVGVQNWLLKSGMTSLRWFMQNATPNGKHGCDLLFGPGEYKWNQSIKDTDHDQIRAICNLLKAGTIVHIWSPDYGTWNGHWLVSNGDGSACGVNNGTINAKDAERHCDVPKHYTRTTTLFEQFAMYGEITTLSGDKVPTKKACMTVHNLDDVNLI